MSQVGQSYPKGNAQYEYERGYYGTYVQKGKRDNQPPFFFVVCPCRPIHKEAKRKNKKGTFLGFLDPARRLRTTRRVREFCLGVNWVKFGNHYGLSCPILQVAWLRW